MNILHTVFATGWGGLEKYPLTLRKGLEEKGHKLIIVTIKGTKLYEEAKNQNIKVYAIDRFKKIDYSIIKFLKKIVDDEKIEIVHLNTSRELYNWYFVLRTRKNLKCFLTFHIGIPNHKGFIHKILYGKVTKVFAISTKEAKKMESQLNIDKNKIELLHNGIELEKFNVNVNSNFRKELNISDEEILVTSIGNLSKPKGILEWVEVSKRITKKIKNVTFIWVGDDSHIKESYSLESLRNEIKNEKLDNKIRLLGYRNEVASILKVSDLFLLPAHNESFGIVYIEAMAMGLPVIGCREGGVPDIIKEENGWLCEPKNILDLERVVVEALKSKKKLNVFKEINRRTVEKFSMDNHINKILSIYGR